MVAETISLTTSQLEFEKYRMKSLSMLADATCAEIGTTDSPLRVSMTQHTFDMNRARWRCVIAAALRGQVRDNYVKVILLPRSKILEWVTSHHCKFKQML